MKKDGFTQINNGVLEEIIGSGLNSTELCVLLAFVRYIYGYHGATCKLSYSRLAKLTNKSISAVKRAINSLEEKEFICRMSKKYLKELPSNVYMLKSYRVQHGITDDTDMVL